MAAPQSNWLARCVLLAVLAVIGLVAFAGIRPTQFWILWLTAGLVALATDGLVRSHARWEDPRAHGSIAHAMLPALIVLGTGHFIDHAVDGYARIAGALVAGAGAGVIAWVEYRTVEPAAAGYGTARLILAVATYFTAFTLFSVVFTADVSQWLGAVACAFVSFFLALELLRESRRLGASSFLVALAVGASLGELRLGLYYFPLDGLLAGALMIIGFYLATGLVHHLLDHDLEWGTAAEYVMVTAGGTAAVIDHPVRNLRLCCWAESLHPAEVTTLKICSWNVNGLRATLKTGDLQAWLAAARPDIVGMQEVKATPDQVDPSAWRDLCYAEVWHTADRPGYSGALLLYKAAPEVTRLGLGIAEFDVEGRVIEADFANLTVVTAYFPNGGNKGARLLYKFAFYEAFARRVTALRDSGRQVVFMGDLNVAHREIDVARPDEAIKGTGFLPEERALLDGLAGAGWVDTFRALHPHEANAFSYWEPWRDRRARNIGWRIDYVWVDAATRPLIEDAFIESHVMGSDHCPVGISLQLE